jgi:His/Glu/Gln/Arg/opine family amino acid ABC transporter permease subunit
MISWMVSWIQTQYHTLIRQPALEGMVEVLSNGYPALLWQATQMTLLVSLSSLGVSLVFGILSGLLRFWRIPVLWRMAALHVELTRGIPLIIQLGVVYYGLPSLHIVLDAFPAGVLALGLYSAAYVSEIVRGGLASVPVGQHEAARSVGLSRVQTMRLIILPQSMVFILPALGNEYISLILGSSLVSSVTITELFRQGSMMISKTYRNFEVYLVLAVVYFAITYSLTLLVRSLERRLSRGRVTAPLLPIKRRVM